MTTLHQLFKGNKVARIVALGLLLAAGGVVLWLLDVVVGFSYGDNTPTAIVGHIVGTMLWGAALAAATRWTRL